MGPESTGPRPTSPNLPAGWRAERDGTGGLDLYVSSSGGPYLLGSVALFTLFACWQTYRNWITSSQSTQLWLVLIALSTLFGLWCGFVNEKWHLGTNSMDHRVGIAGHGYCRSYKDATLEIHVALRRSRLYSTPYYRLYAVTAGEPHFLFERDQETLQQLAIFISFHTGWLFQSAQGVGNA
ncbi:MAG TPA: hypothetical protein VGU90_11430 [Terriglobales bacterium]|nr:hypothetical protein [Terriglobales bacterium]